MVYRLRLVQGPGFESRHYELSPVDMYIRDMTEILSTVQFDSHIFIYTIDSMLNFISDVATMKPKMSKVL